MTEKNLARVLTIAAQLARMATEKHLAKHGDRDCCGFAWVTVPGRSPVAQYMKAHPGHAGLQFDTHYRGGYCFWNPARHGTQALSALEAGAEAFAEALRLAGFEAHADSRMD